MRLRGRLVLPDRIVADGVVEIAGDRILEVRERIDAGDPPARSGVTLMPGLVDAHCHGGAGAAFGAEVEVAGHAAARQVARHHLEHGTTSVVASLVTADRLALAEGARSLAALSADGVLAGIHLEGPFLAESRRGAHDSQHLLAPDLGVLEELLEASAGHLRQVTIAPELPGALPLIARLASAGVIAAVGHTDAGFEAASQGFAAGANLATHLFNGMRPWHHRNAGAAAASLAAAGRGLASVELIADGVHVDAGTASTVHDLLGPERVLLVSDAMAAAGRGDGTYQLASVRVQVRDGVARVADGTAAGSIAGSTSTLLDVVRWAHRQARWPLADAVRSATLTPARMLGLAGDRGALAAGLRADLLAVDDDLRPVAVMRGGSWVHGLVPGWAEAP